jgi:hypothetical protein
MDNTNAYVIAMGKPSFSDYSVTESHNANLPSIVLNPAIYALHGSNVSRDPRRSCSTL